MDESVEILRAIWGEMKALNAGIDRTREELGSRIDQTNERLDQTNRRLDQTNERLDQNNRRLESLEGVVAQLARRQVEAETRVASELVKVARAVTDTQRLLRERLDLRDRVEEHERRILALEERLGG